MYTDRHKYSCLAGPYNIALGGFPSVLPPLLAPTVSEPLQPQHLSRIFRRQMAAENYYERNDSQEWMKCIWSLIFLSVTLIFVS